MDKLANVYLQFYIDWAIGINTFLVYYMGHLIPATLFIGLCIYVNAMLSDLQIQLHDIDGDVNNREQRTDFYLQIGYKLCNEFQFTVHIYKLSILVVSTAD